jgi:hypothetical protein
VLTILLTAAVGLLIDAKEPKPRRGRRPIWHYLLVWPILLDKSRQNVTASGRIFTTREIVGWIIVLLLAISAFVFEL